MVDSTRRALVLGTLVLLGVSTKAPAQTVVPTLVITGGASSSPARVNEITSRRLANGLRVIVSPQSDTAHVVVWVSYQVGSRDDPSDYHGLAHLMEHMMFQRTAHVAEDQFGALLEHAGATDINATTSRDRTDYYEVLPAEQLPLALWLESDRMAFVLPAIDAAAVESQRRVVLNEHALRHGATGAIASSALAQMLYPQGHPYRDAFEDADDLRAIRPADLAWFFEQHYAPHLATLVIAGDVDVEPTYQLVEHYFGSIRDRQGATRAAVQLPTGTAVAHTLTIEAPMPSPIVKVSWRTPSYFQPGDAELDLIADILAGDDDAPMRAELLQSAQAQSVDAWEQSGELGSEFSVLVEVTEGADPSVALAIIDGHLERIRHGQIDPVLVESTRWGFRRSILLQRESPFSRAAALARYDDVLGDPDGFERDSDRYMNATIASLAHAATTFLAADHRVVEVLRPRPGAPHEGRIVSPRARRSVVRGAT